MPKFRVIEYHQTTLTYLVDAENKDEAVNIVNEMLWDDADQEEGPSHIETIVEEIDNEEEEDLKEKINEN